MNSKAKPFIKWVGGKGQLIEQLEMKLPADFDNWDDATYIEPLERLIKLNQIAIQQMRILEDTGDRNLLK
jgi:DNA adenine methylase